MTPELLELVNRALPHIKVEESYGLTEGGSPLRPPIDGRPVPRGSPGAQAPEIELKMIDANGNETQEEGELLIRCPTSASATSTTRRSPGEASGRVASHRRPVRQDKDGFYYFRSRVDDMFTCGGENVYPKEVENLLFGHPDVVNAVVTPVPHQVKGLRQPPW